MRIPAPHGGGAGGVQDLAFAAPAATRVAISFDAECAVGGANFVTQANVTILLDAAPPGLRPALPSRRDRPDQLLLVENQRPDARQGRRQRLSHGPMS